MLSEQRILRDQVSATACGIREDTNDKSAGERLGVVFDELFQVAGKLLPSVDYGLDHAVIDSK